VGEQHAAAGGPENHIRRERYGQALNAQTSSSRTCRGKEKDVPDILPIVTNASHNLLWIVIRGGIVMIPLLASSVIALTVIVERLYFWMRLRSQAANHTILALSRSS
jgi:hypothetical protein